jgi:hypothetical protein
METDKIINDISSLPPEAQQQVLDFVAFLRSRYRIPDKEKPRKPAELTNESFVGIWKDREEMQDSAKWLRTIRRSEWGEPSA